ncbi:hypothetical protein [Saccharophagus degradans]|nr:hypothetical protein [Saccharophagus degradans]
MNNIYDLIETISTRTAMYTGEHKLSNIRSFIDGYTFSIKNKAESLEFLSDFPGFHDWVAKRLGFYESTAGWQNMILAIEMEYSPKNIKWVGYADGATELQHKASVTRFFDMVNEYKNA